MSMQPLSIAGARLGFKNFEGKEGPYNKAGDRSFAIFLDRDYAEELAEQGWNIKFPTGEGAEDRNPYLPVAVGFEYFPPKVMLVQEPENIFLDEESVGMLDWSQISNADVVIRPYEWTVNGNSGVKAYLKALYVTLDEDEFAAKYR